MTQVIVAAGTRCSAQAGADVAALGGNAVDAAVGATIASWVCEPGMTAIGSALLGLVRPAGGQPYLVDGLTAQPGLGGHQATPPGGHRITMPYGPGVETGVGAGSVAVPGGPAGVELLQQEWGRLSWPEVLAPAIALARDGFAYPSVSANYLPFSGEPIYDLTPGSRAIWRHPDGRPRTAGDQTCLPDLADDLERLAAHGASDFYTGVLAERISTWIVEHGGAMSAEDLAAYAVDVREPLCCQDDGWHVAACDTIGGRLLVDLIAGFSAIDSADDDAALQLIDCLGKGIEQRDAILRRASSSTTQVCAVDVHGNACSITTSTGYGSGVVVPRTGSMLNNMLGELELLPHGPNVLQPGQRLPSNMTPMIATREDDVVAIGAAGADRISSAIAQTWRGMKSGAITVSEAIGAPRCHLRYSEEGRILEYEPGFDPDGFSGNTHGFDHAHMYFGGVQAVSRRSGSPLDGAGDPRRGGAVAWA